MTDSQRVSWIAAVSAGCHARASRACSLSGAHGREARPWHPSKICTWLLAAAMTAAIGCGAREAVKKAETAPTAASRPRIPVVRPERKAIRRSITQPGQIEAFDQARLYVKVAGYVERYLVDIGDKVTGTRLDADGRVIGRGQLLAVLSAPEVDQELVQKKALVAQANADTEQSQATVKAAEADVTSAQSRQNEATAAIDRFEAEYQKWSSEYARVAELVNRSAVPQKL